MDEAMDDHVEDGDFCADCGKAIFYDFNREEYRHSARPEEGCFLIRAEPSNWASCPLPAEMRREADEKILRLWGIDPGRLS